MNAENRLKLLKSAEKYFKQGKIELAVKEYQKILEIKPDDLEVRRIIGDLQLKLNIVPEALHQFQWIADYYLKEGFFTKAIAMYKRITRLAPQNEDVSFKLADLYSRQGLVIEAKQIYLELAEEYKRQNNQRKALGIYKKILEFDRNNIKMRQLLAENYLKENMQEEAVNEYLITSDILIKKKEFPQAEEVLNEVYGKLRHPKLLNKLISCYIGQGEESKAIDVIRGMGEELNDNIAMLKILGELYFKNNRIDEAEKIFKRISEIDPSETEVIVRLGKVYLQREEIEKAFHLFLPTIDKLLEAGKYDEANSLLRLIITTSNTYLPALNKLAEVFKLSNKTNSLIALYESLIPIYEQREMRAELIQTLQALIELSNAPFVYQEQLARITGMHEAEEEDHREEEFISFQLRNADAALKESDYPRAVELLITAKNAFPRNVEIKLKLFDIYQLTNNIDALMNEGMELLELYKLHDNDEEYRNLLDKLTRLKPNDERLLDLSGHENTNIEIDFDHDELIEQMHELHQADLGKIEMPPVAEEEGEADVLVLTGEDSVFTGAPPPEVEQAKGLSSQLVELDFYINEGYFDDAEKIVERLKKDYPESKQIVARLEKIRRGKNMQTEVIPTPPPAAHTVPVEPTQPTGESLFVLDEPAPLAPEFAVPADLGLGTEPFTGFEDINFDIQMDEPVPLETLPPLQDLGYQPPVRPAAQPSGVTEFAPPAVPSERVAAPAAAESGLSKSGTDFIDLDHVLALDDSELVSDSPFREIEAHDFLSESEEDILRADGLLMEDEAYFEPELKVRDEISGLNQWVQELEKQRTSTIEKNMMEIFKEFKKGVDEKIGHEDYDTRYNLGIAYKEMGLIEEAIHEFLIAAKHPLKIFDSAGLLGICFREKGMLDEAVTWFEKAHETPDRKEEEYRAVKYELFLTTRQKEDYAYAKRLAQEIMKQDPNYRNIREIYEEIKNK